MHTEPENSYRPLKNHGSSLCRCKLAILISLIKSSDHDVTASMTSSTEPRRHNVFEGRMERNVEKLIYSRRLIIFRRWINIWILRGVDNPFAHQSTSAIDRHGE